MPHSSRDSKERFSSRVDAYVAARPWYPREVIDHLKQTGGLTPAWHIVDLGSGTGISCDLFLANGHPDDMIGQYSQMVKYKEPLLVFHNNGTKLENVSATAGPVFTKSYPARGLAIGDYNNDGRIDVLIGNNGEAPVLLKNNAGEGNHWVGLKLQGTSCNRDAIGARLTWSVGGVVRRKMKNAGGSYLSAHDPREVIGLGTATKLDYLEITWPKPSGKKERFEDVPIDRYVTIVEGKGKIET